MWDELSNIKSDKAALKEFGVTIGAVLIILADIAAFKGKNTYAYFLWPGIAFAALGISLPGVLRPLQVLWMGFSIILGFFMNRVIMALLFYFVVTPINMVIKIIGKDVLDQRIDKTKPSYWSPRDGVSKDRKYYENQY